MIYNHLPINERAVINKFIGGRKICGLYCISTRPIPKPSDGFAKYIDKKIKHQSKNN
jgi:hypothetical protein